MKNQFKNLVINNAFQLFLAVLLVSSSCCFANSTVKVVDLRCEYRTNPLGIDNTLPRLSWKLLESQQLRGQKQTAYQIVVSTSIQNLHKNIGDLWDSGKVESNQSVNTIYNGKRLISGQECFWKVRIWDVSGVQSNWSEDAKFTMGLLNKEDWKGEWIFKKDQKKTDHNWYRKNINLSEQPSSAYVYLGSFGYHELYVNGQKVTDNVMNPVSSYMKKRIPYLTYDIRKHLKKGKNVIAVWHAAGWARWDRITEYRNPPFAFKAQVEIQLGTTQLALGTDETWKCKVSNSQYYGDWDILRFGGETIDDRKKEDNWNAADYDDSNWSQAGIYNAEELNKNIPERNENVTVNEDKVIGLERFKNRRFTEITAELSAQMVEPQVKFEEVNPIAIQKNADGTYRIDMGRNYTGFFEMKLYKGAVGDSILFEISDQTEKVMNWEQKSKYIYGKSGEGKFTNRFNVAGGRWITVYGLKYEPKLADIKGFVITNDRKRISSFESSSKLLNQIYKTNLDTYLANTLDGILMDCPHRERRGWGEVTVAAMYGDALPNFESGAYMDQYLQYTRDSQFPDGQIRGVINENDRPFLMWKANSPLTVWETYRMLGDKKVLEDNYESMKKWMTWMYQNSNYESGGALITGPQGARDFPGLGDWCTPKGNFWTSSNSPEAIHFNNCVYAFMLDNAEKMALELNKTEEAKIFANRLKVQREATHKMTYNAETGQYGNGQQVNQAFALIAGVTPEAEKKKVTDVLVDNVLYKFPYYDTGSSGQGMYTRYFTEYGERMDLIYELLQDKHHPSYGYFIAQGETVWPERWSSVGVSKIHTCYTGIGGYFIKGFGGIRPNPKSLGMQNMIIKPAVVGDLTFANTAYESMYGKVIVNWTKKNNTANFHIEVPVNSTAQVYVPAVSKNGVKEGKVLAENAKGISFLGTEKNDAVGNYVIYNVSSGIYDFQVSELPKTVYPEPIGTNKNLALLGRMNASSMFIETEKLPGFEAFKANDENNETSWQAKDANNQYLEVEWVKPQTFSKVIINELGTTIEGYKIQFWNGKEWKVLATGKSCGQNKEHNFKTVTATKCRITIDKGQKAVSIAEFKIYM
ncbi:family 78 glycoside hydrolase catalytic domain [Flavobacterium sp. NG2]|uniref:family 78 glycoside hydrolase catalytic domain n=1 Tax=Flavobacterium sp. NG2 TaxID=3097547 RepID=UPI002A823037|nr:family 78 glycoside hydrolase catalytic domain [Flavobacterium sp. NG2]WPR70123.1 family 78 glycoside hydrolase catalytic domain [Flavobacterium sp. NG2]